VCLRASAAVRPTCPSGRLHRGPEQVPALGGPVASGWPGVLAPPVRAGQSLWLASPGRVRSGSAQHLPSPRGRVLKTAHSRPSPRSERTVDRPVPGHGWLAVDRRPPNVCRSVPGPVPGRARWAVRPGPEKPGTVFRKPGTPAVERVAPRRLRPRPRCALWQRTRPCRPGGPGKHRRSSLPGRPGPSLPGPLRPGLFPQTVAWARLTTPRVSRRSWEPSSAYERTGRRGAAVRTSLRSADRSGAAQTRTGISPSRSASLAR